MRRNEEHKSRLDETKCLPLIWSLPSLYVSCLLHHDMNAILHYYYCLSPFVSPRRLPPADSNTTYYIQHKYSPPCRIHLLHCLHAASVRSIQHYYSPLPTVPLPLQFQHRPPSSMLSPHPTLARVYQRPRPRPRTAPEQPCSMRVRARGEIIDTVVPLQKYNSTWWCGECVAKPPQVRKLEFAVLYCTVPHRTPHLCATGTLASPPSPPYEISPIIFPCLTKVHPNNTNTNT